MKSLLYQRQWELDTPADDLVHSIQDELNCSSAFARTVAVRYGANYETLLKPPSQLIHDPYDLPDFERAIIRIEQAINRSESIFIHGDFDVDGLTSAAIIYRGLNKIPRLDASKTKVAVSNRKLGHGLDPQVTSQILNEGFDLLITTDCGIKEHEEIQHLQSFGTDVIVTDHHQPPAQLPPAKALVNPKRSDATYPNPNLAGAGIAYKLISGLYDRLNLDGGKGDLIQLATVGTIADLTPLKTKHDEENKMIVKRGLENLSERPITGLSALRERLNLPSPVTTRDIGYRIGPKINAANRVGDPKVGFLLLTTENPDRARYLTDILLDYDKDRSRLQSEILRECEKQIASLDPPPQENGIIIVYGEDWNLGILGLVASRLVDKYHVPSIVMSKTGTRLRGSVRSVEGIDITKGLNHCSKYLIRFGGHKMAAGFQLHHSNLSSLRQCLQNWISDQVVDHDRLQTETIDAELTWGEISKELYKELNQLEPYGLGNPRPYFTLKDPQILSFRKVGKTKTHLKLKMGGEGNVIDCIGFGMAPAAKILRRDNTTCQPVFQLGQDTWKGKREIQLELEDFITD